MRFIENGKISGDETRPYIVKDYNAKTVGEFVKEVLLKCPNEWGTITAKSNLRHLRWCNNECEYKYGELLSEMDSVYLVSEIVSVTASGGWSRMDYYILTK